MWWPGLANYFGGIMGKNGSRQVELDEVGM